MSGGVYGSPQLLMLSGVGPAEHLTNGIPVVHDMRASANLHDHFNTYVAYVRPARHMNDL